MTLRSRSILKKIILNLFTLFLLEVTQGWHFIDPIETEIFINRIIIQQKSGYLVNFSLNQIENITLIQKYVKSV